MRCFVAVDLPQPVRNHLAKVTAPLRERFELKWVPREQLHVTLAFAGELPDDNVDALADVVRGLAPPPLEVALTGLAAFPARGVPRVVWASLGEDDGALQALHDELMAAAEPLGVPREKRGFSPHVTLGRVKSPFGAMALVDQLQATGEELNRKPFAPLAVTLYRSTLRPGGPVHEPIARRPLSPGRG